MYLPSKLAIKKALAYKSLYEFMKLFWTEIDPSEFIPGWHLEAICEHLEAVSAGKITRLIINMPPRHCKSSLVSVMWPAWAWLHNPRIPWMYTSYAHQLAMRDNIKCRRIVELPLYMDIIRQYHPNFKLARDENTMKKFANNLGGYKLTASIGGKLTGDGGDFVICDDPNNVLESESDVIRNGTNRWFDESLRSRLNPKAIANLMKGAFVVIQQRTHETDLSGYLLEGIEKWDHLCMPFRYEGMNRNKTTLKFKDPRTVEGTPLWEEIHNEESMVVLEEGFGPYAAAGQLQQRPAPREGGMFKVGRIEILSAFPSNLAVRSIRYWDKAGTAGGGAYTAGVLIHLTQEGKFVIGDMVRGQWSALDREKIIKNTAISDGLETIVWVEQEPGSAGKDVAEATIRNLAGFSVFAERPTGDKTTRADPFSAQVEGNNVCMVKARWNKEYKHELEMFPVGKYRDQVDASSGAFNKLYQIGNRAGAWGRRHHDSNRR